ncbi:M81 family metallopeptidase [bacterium]|nr:M81 family metallopeptidase [bacterium]
MKLFCGMLGTETNTYSPMPTGWNVWKDMLLHHRGDSDDGVPALFQGIRTIMSDTFSQRGWESEFGLFAFAQPAGLTPRAVYEDLRDEMLDNIKSCLPVDGVLLILHGAMVADGYQDCEGDLLAHVRDLVGPDVPVGAELDLHCHMTQKMVDNATVLVGYKEYPHVDVLARMKELFTILADAAEGKVAPCISVFRCRMIGMMRTTEEPMRSFVDELSAMEGKNGVLNAWIGHGFPYGDVPDLGTTLVVVTDDDPQGGADLAETLGRRLFAMRKEVCAVPQSLVECLDLAVQAEAGPVTIADTADNAGGGAPSDSTFFLAEMMARGIENAAIAPLWDPIAVAICQDAGLHARVTLRIGGKMGPMSGAPVDVEATVIGLADQVIDQMGDVNMSYGATAAVKIHLHKNSSDLPASGIDVILTQKRAQGYSPRIFSEVGVEPLTKKILVVKSTQHFHAGFAPISKQILYAGDLGALPGDMLKIPYQHADTTCLWPFTDDPFAA